MSFQSSADDKVQREAIEQFIRNCKVMMRLSIHPADLPQGENITMLVREVLIWFSYLTLTPKWRFCVNRRWVIKMHDVLIQCWLCRLICQKDVRYFFARCLVSMLNISALCHYSLCVLLCVFQFDTDCIIIFVHTGIAESASAWYRSLSFHANADSLFLILCITTACPWSCLNLHDNADCASVHYCYPKERAWSRPLSFHHDTDLSMLCSHSVCVISSSEFERLCWLGIYQKLTS